MDTFPGMQFEPGSLHKYLYCENRPVDRWDPSGMMTYTLIEKAVIVFAMGVLVSIFWNSLGWAASFIKEMYEPAVWNGFLLIQTVGTGGATLGIITGNFKGTHSSRKPFRGSGIYITIVAGVSLSLLYNISWTLNAELYSPGLFGAAPWTLVGPATWISSSFVVGGWGYSGTLGTMGFGVYYPISEMNGLDVGVDYLAGITFPLWLDPWPWE